MSLRYITVRAVSLDFVRDSLLAGFWVIRPIASDNPRLAYLERAYNQAAAKRYRIDRKTWVERDDDGILAQPVNLSDWPECTLEDARFALCRGVWSDAARLYNLDHLLPLSGRAA